MRYLQILQLVKPFGKLATSSIREGEQVARWVGAVRYARCGTPKQTWSSSKLCLEAAVTGEPRETETLMRWFGEEALEKYPIGQLAGVLLYLMSGF